MSIYEGAVNFFGCGLSIYEMKRCSVLNGSWDFGSGTSQKMRTLNSAPVLVVCGYNNVRHYYTRNVVDFRIVLAWNETNYGFERTP
jgi:hypothetical protein